MELLAWIGTALLLCWFLNLGRTHLSNGDSERDMPDGFEDVYESDEGINKV